MKKFKIFIYLNLFFLILISCSTVEDGFKNQKKNNSDEFLVEKKKPLSMPPDFEKLPEPDIENSEKYLESNGIKNLIITNKESQRSNDEVSNLETSIIEKIKNN
jgi:PBP1b-binding outer membrane lipoprotein LpoB